MAHSNSLACTGFCKHCFGSSALCSLDKVQSHWVSRLCICYVFFSPRPQTCPESSWLMALNLIYTNANISSTFSKTFRPWLRFLMHFVHGKCDEVRVPRMPRWPVPHYLLPPFPLCSSSKHKLNNRMMIIM